MNKEVSQVLKFYEVSVSVKVMAASEEDAQSVGYDWVRSSDIECFQATEICEVDETIEWLVQMDALLTRGFSSWQERYETLRRLYVQTWGVAIACGKWESVMEAVERHGETILADLQEKRQIP